LYYGHAVMSFKKFILFLVLVIAGQLVTSGFDKKLLLWDMHMEKASSWLRSLEAEVNSMSVYGFNLVVSIGASVHVYDLRNFDKPVLSKEAFNGTHSRCVSSIPNAEGMNYVVLFYLVKLGKLQLFFLIHEEHFSSLIIFLVIGFFRCL